MKRVVKILLLLVFIMPYSVKADMGAPIIAPYKVVPKSVDGAPYYDSDCSDDECVKIKVGVIPYDTEVEVLWDYYDYEDKKTYGDIDIGDNTYIIDISDFMEITTEYKPNYDSYDTKSSTEGYVIANDGLVMRKGPSVAYEKVGVTIPKGEKIKITIKHGEEGTVWVYTSYNGKKGWVKYVDGGLGFLNTERDIQYYKEIPVYEYVDKKTKVGTIKPYEVIEKVYFVDAWTQMYYVEHDGVKGYIEYDYEINEVDHDYYKDVYFKKGSSIRKEPKDGTKIVKKLEKDTLIEIIGSTTVERQTGENEIDVLIWYYVEHAGVKGWILETSMTKETQDRLFGDYEDEYLEDEDIEEGEEEPKEQPTTTAKKVTKKNKKSTNPKEIVILCVGAAIIVAVTAIVTIILVNKKNKTKESNEKQEEPITPELEKVETVEENKKDSQ